MSQLNQQTQSTAKSPQTDVKRKWTKEELQKMVNDGRAHLIPTEWTKSESWQAFKCVEVNDQVCFIPSCLDLPFM
jgi:hypothetical protein